MSSFTSSKVMTNSDSASNIANLTSNFTMSTHVQLEPLHKCISLAREWKDHREGNMKRGWEDVKERVVDIHLETGVERRSFLGGSS